MAAKTIILITGANTGLGLQTVRTLLESQQQYHILLGSRSLEKGYNVIADLNKEYVTSKHTIEPLQVDVESDDSINEAFKQVQAKYGRIDVLVNNAGASFDWEVAKGNMTMREVWNKAYDVNVSGTQVMTYTFMPLLLKSTDPRLLFLTSGLSSLDELSRNAFPTATPVPAGWPKPRMQPVAAYRSSKTALNMMMLNWVTTLKEDGVKVWCISPGFLATGLGGDTEMLKKLGAGDPSDGGKFIGQVIEGQRDHDVGKVVKRGGIQPW